METISPESFKLSKLKMIPRKINNGYNIDLLYNDKHFGLQSPKCTIEEIIYNNNDITNIEISFKINKNFKYYQFFGVFDNILIDYLQNFVVQHKIMPQKTVSEVFNSGTNSDFNSEKVFLNLKINKETLFFTRDFKKTFALDFNKGDKVVFIFFTKGIFLDTHGINYRWTAKQMLKYNIKK